jgi:acetolactate synthase small subunit
MSTPEVKAEMQALVLLVNMDGAGSLERVLGLLRRRAPTIAAMNVTASEGSDVACVTVMLRSPHAVAEQVAEHLRKLVDVRDCAVMHGNKTVVAP